jgi:hypothetical protein
VAAELGISDVALAKRCKKLNVPKPSIGYWAKVAAGQKPEKMPLPSLVASANEVFAQAAEQPLPKAFILPETIEQLHPLATELLRTLSTAKPSYDKRIWCQELALPEVKIGKGSIEQAAKCFHVIVTNVESVGIPFRKAQGYHNPGFFRKGNDRLYLEIEGELVESTEANRRRAWQSPEDHRVPSGKLTFSLHQDRYARRDAKRWTEDDKKPLGEVLAQVVAEIRRHFVAVQKQREREAIERRQQAIEWEKRQQEWKKEEAIRHEKERQQKHAAALEATAHARSEDLMKAAEWWRLYRTAMDFINECEQRWRNSEDLTAEQQAWLAWAREKAKAMSPFEMGYPDATADGPFDPTVIPIGGPYPAKRDFPRPPTMPKIPPPVIQQQSGYNPSPQPKEQFPFWLMHRGR